MAGTQTFVRDGVETSEVPGWYDYQPWHDRAVATAPPGSTIVEVGVFCGKSLIGLARKARVSGKNLQIVGVDTFHGSPEFEGRVFFDDRTWPDIPDGMIARFCIALLKDNGVLDDVSLIVADSVRAARLFAPRSIHAVFLDADHSEEGVAADIAAWLPKIASGGLIGGHDYWQFPTVRETVDRLLPDCVVDSGRSWWEKEC